MKKILVRRLGVASVAKFIGAAYAILGLVYGFIATFPGMAVVITNNDYNTLEKVFASVGVILVLVVVVPLLAFVFGWLYGAILALVGNLFLSTSQGIELDIEEEK